MAWLYRPFFGLTGDCPSSSAHAQMPPPAAVLYVSSPHMVMASPATKEPWRKKIKEHNDRHHVGARGVINYGDWELGTVLIFRHKSDQFVNC
jgi:hypothetical protein